MKTKTTKEKKPTLVHEIDKKDWQLYRLAFTPDSRMLILAPKGHDTTVMDLGSWNCRTFPRPPIAAVRVVFSPDSASFIVTSFNFVPLQCLETKTNAVRWSLTPGSMDAEFSPDGKLVAATQGKSVLLCDTGNGRIHHKMAGHKSRVDHVRFSADGRRVASAAQSQVCLWDVQSGTLVAMVQEKQGEISAITLSGDGHILAAATGKGSVSTYDTITGQKQCEWQAGTSHIWNLHLSADGKRLLDYGRLWELPECRQIYQAPPDSLCKFTPDGRALVVLADGMVELVDLEGRSLNKAPLKNDQKMITFAVSPDRNWLACSSSDKLAIWKVDGVL
ncbi:MAG: hypothetical protein P4N60_17520 [Verrucomicrobiae bacterium]|nr:hypothetical protein [Verrucomicrobiae bacterium]